MIYWIIPLTVILLLILTTTITALICFFKIFYTPNKKDEREYPLPEGDIYRPYHPQMMIWMNDMRTLPYRDVEIVSHDGLRLCGKYYEKEKGAPIEILFHGYKGTAERDLCGAVHRCFALGFNALIVDQRGAGRSEGHVITFGAKESIDCQRWIDFVIKNIDPNAKIIITGISMGASTVMVTAGRKLPPNVVGVLADCGYTSTRDIIKKVMSEMRLPPDLLYPFARLGAILFGGFDPDGDTPILAMSKCKLPVLFFHGDADDYVPCYMSQQNYDSCASDQKRFVIMEGAGHGLSFPIDMKKYLSEAQAFFEPILR